MIKKQYQQGNAFLPYLTLVVIAGLITTNLWLYFWDQKEITASQPQTVDTTTDLTADSQTYTNSRYGFSFTPLSDSCSPLGCSSTAAELSPNGNVEILIQTVDGAKSPKQWLTTHGLSDSRISVVNSLLDGEPAVTFKNNSTDNIPWNFSSDDGIKRGLLVTTGSEGVLALKNNHSYLIYYGHLLNTSFDDKTNYQQILSTFRFTDDMSNWKTYTDNEWNLTFKYPADWKVDGQSQEKSLSIIPPDVAKKTGIELTPTMGIRAVTKVPNHAPSGTTPEKVNSDYDCNQNYRLMTINGVAAQRQDESCFATIRSTYLPKDLEYLRISWPEVFEKDYPQFEKILSTFRFAQPEVTIPADWKTYNNNELGLSFMYPPSIGSLNATTIAHHGETIFWPPGGKNVTLYGKAVRVYKASSDIYKSDFTLYSKTKDYLQLADGACDSPSCVDAMTIEKISQDCGKRFPSDGYYRECLILNNHQIEIEVYPNEASEYYAVAYMVWDHNDYPTVTTVSKIWTADPQLSPNQAQAKLKELLASEQPSSARTAYNEFKTILSTFRFTK